MILYHTSTIEVKNPNISFSRTFLDFGKGFYTTPNKVQAQKYARRFFKEDLPAVLNIYDLDDEIIDDVFNTLDLYMAELITREEAIKRLRKKKPNWQICLCRQELIGEHLHFIESQILQPTEV